jgi:glycosyltransferase involved in cell wall biosynthesis
MGLQFINSDIDIIPNDEWIYILDDDNIIHEDFYENISDIIKNNPDKLGIIFSQKVGGVDFTKLDIREASPDNVKVSKIDSAQFLLKREIIGNNRLESGSYFADGILMEKLYSEENKEKFYFTNKVLCYYNKLIKINPGVSLPRVLLIGENENLKSIKVNDYESDDLNVRFIENDSDLMRNLIEFDPDSIITKGIDYTSFPNMCYQNLDIRQRWLHFLPGDQNIGNSAYECSMSYILNNKRNQPLVSIFTPIYKTGEKLNRTYESIKNQTYTNWEWVIVDDSDDLETSRIAQNIKNSDNRIKFYNFDEKSNGIIGESKYRAAVLCRGEYLLELDHDDYLTTDALEYMTKAFLENPDCKFVYSDCAEIDENKNSLTYGNGFAFGYGSYREEVYDGVVYKVPNTQNINPKTIRHIVGVPNHFRAWERIFYLSIGGHNRRLTIADDYELLVRTFLNTKMIRIPKLLYLQYFHGGNSQDSSRADIQRRVRTIASFYNTQINKRFVDLGIEDWAYNGNPGNPLMTPSRFGVYEGSANKIYNLVKEETEYII